jgi:hypothetical protein
MELDHSDICDQLHIIRQLLVLEGCVYMSFLESITFVSGSFSSLSNQFALM